MPKIPTTTKEFVGWKITEETLAKHNFPLQQLYAYLRRPNKPFRTIYCLAAASSKNGGTTWFRLFVAEADNDLVEVTKECAKLFGMVEFSYGHYGIAVGGWGSRRSMVIQDKLRNALGADTPFEDM